MHPTAWHHSDMLGGTGTEGPLDLDMSRPNLTSRGHCEDLDHVTTELIDMLGIMAALFMASKDKMSFDSCNREGGTGRD